MGITFCRKDDSGAFFLTLHQGPNTAKQSLLAKIAKELTCSK